MSDTMLPAMLIYGALLLVYVTSPFSLTLWLLFFSILLAMIAYLKLSAWVAYMFIAVYGGGMLVCVLYVASFAGNDKFYMNNYYVSSSVFATSLSIAGSFYLMSTMSSGGFLGANSLMQIYSGVSNILVVFLVGYMFLTLLLIVKLSETHQGAVVFSE